MTGACSLAVPTSAFIRTRCGGRGRGKVCVCGMRVVGGGTREKGSWVCKSVGLCVSVVACKGAELYVSPISLVLCCRLAASSSAPGKHRKLSDQHRETLVKSVRKNHKRKPELADQTATCQKDCKTTKRPPATLRDSGAFRTDSPEPKAEARFFSTFLSCLPS